MRRIILLTPVNNSRCDSNPCQNGATCEAHGGFDSKLTYVPRYQCYCLPGYSGKHCEGEYYRWIRVISGNKIYLLTLHIDIIYGFVTMLPIFIITLHTNIQD